MSPEPMSRGLTAFCLAPCKALNMHEAEHASQSGSRAV